MTGQWAVDRQKFKSLQMSCSIHHDICVIFKLICEIAGQMHPKWFRHLAGHVKIVKLYIDFSMPKSTTVICGNRPM